MTFNIIGPLKWPQQWIKRRVWVKKETEEPLWLDSGQLEPTLWIRSQKYCSHLFSFCSFWFWRRILTQHIIIGVYSLFQERCAAVTVLFRLKNWWTNFGWRQAWRELRYVRITNCIVAAHCHISNNLHDSESTVCAGMLHIMSFITVLHSISPYPVCNIILFPFVPKDLPHSNRPGPVLSGAQTQWPSAHRHCCLIQPVQR